MFERYTDKATRVLFFARYEASQFGSPCIDTEHLLLGLLREDRLLAARLLNASSTVEGLRRQIEEHYPTREKVSTSVDLFLSEGSKQALAYGAEEAERASGESINTGHLLCGLLRTEASFAAQILNERGVTLQPAREVLAGLEPGAHDGK